MISAILAFLSLTIAVVWSIVFLPASLFGIRVSKVTGSKMSKFLKKVAHSSIWTNDEPGGWICGKWFIGFVHVVSGERNETKELWIMTSKRFYETNIQQKEVSEDGKSNSIIYWTREGVFWNLRYNSRQLPLPKRPIREKQDIAVKRIIETFQDKNHAVCLLHGKAGGGKSMTAQYLCAELLKTKKAVNFCDTHAPHDHGDNFDAFYNKINPTEDSPLVLVFEEVDGMLLKVHMERVEQRHHIPVQIKTKTDWNCFLDKFDREIYPHVILIMTTNRTDRWFDELDVSYMREGRVDLKIPF